MFTFRPGSLSAQDDKNEIDMEFVRLFPRHVHTNVFFDSRPPGTQGRPRRLAVGFDPSTRFADYTIEWTPEIIRWSADGKLIREEADAHILASFKGKRLGIRFNIWSASAAAKWTRSWAGEFDPGGLPVCAFIDWVEASEYEPSTKRLTRVWRDDFDGDSLDPGRWAKGTWLIGGADSPFDPRNVVVRDSMMVLCLTDEHATGFSASSAKALQSLIKR